MREHCAQCLMPIPPGLECETPRGELMCDSCFRALWGPNGLALRHHHTRGRPPAVIDRPLTVIERRR